MFGEPENISVGEQFSENQGTVLREPEHGSLRTRIQFSENQSTVLREPEHDSLRTRARLSENQSAPKLENTSVENRRTSPCSPRAPNLLNVLPSRMVGWNDLCTPALIYFKTFSFGNCWTGKNVHYFVATLLPVPVSHLHGLPHPFNLPLPTFPPSHRIKSNTKSNLWIASCFTCEKPEGSEVQILNTHPTKQFLVKPTWEIIIHTWFK